MHASNRAEDRVSMAVPVHLQGGGHGLTRDISASGIYFETDLEPIRESPLDFTVEFQNGGVGGLQRDARRLHPAVQLQQIGAVAAERRAGRAGGAQMVEVGLELR